MATGPPGATALAGGDGDSPKTYFEEQREGLCREIALSLENVLQNINKLNRSLEGVIAVGNEFGSVEALWSQFENVMASNAGTAQRDGDGDEDEDEAGDVDGGEEAEAKKRS